MPESWGDAARVSQIRCAVNGVPPPEDFAHFWQRTMSELVAVEPAPCAVAGVSGGDGPVAAQFRSLGGAQVRCWFSSPRTPLDQEPRPLLITCHGYGGQVESERVRRLASFGMNVVGVDARGFGESRAAVPELCADGYLLTGGLAPDTSILRGAVCDYLQSYRAALTWFGAPSQVTFHGFSFAGGLSLMAAALLARYAGGAVPGLPSPPDILATGAPTFGHVALRVQLCQEGSGHELARYLRRHPERAAQILRTQSYFDACYFAPFLVQGSGGKLKRILFGVGLEDPVVPAETVFSILNAMPEPPEIFEMPCSHTERAEEAQWARFETAWIKAACRPI